MLPGTGECHIYTRVEARDLYIDEAHMSQDILRFAVLSDFEVFLGHLSPLPHMASGNHFSMMDMSVLILYLCLTTGRFHFCGNIYEYEQPYKT